MDLLIVEDDDTFRSVAAEWMRRKGHQITEASGGKSAMDLVNQRQFDVAIIDLNLPDLCGLSLLRSLRSESEDLEVIMLTGEATVETAVEAMKHGACDYLSKQFPLAELEERCRKAAEARRLRRDNRRWKSLAVRDQPLPKLIGDSPQIREIHRLIERVGPTEVPVLIQGETGTGKELAARAIQRTSRRATQPFVTVNCAAFPDQLVESELFGHEKGAFTGAVSTRPGLFEMADEGTLFIDEVGELPLSLQPKLLRVLEDGSFRRVGSSVERRVNVRVIAATNRNLLEEVHANRFREDLLYRINVLSITMPSLRDHGPDLPLLLRHFLPKDWEVEPEAELALSRYRWPGNVRQLKNVLERAVILAEDRTITLEDLPNDIVAAINGEFATDCDMEDETSLMSIKRAHVQDILERCNGNKSQAARLLGIHRRKLYRLMERLGFSTR